MQKHSKANDQANMKKILDKAEEEESKGLNVHNMM
jgi:hypothetical protein